MAFWAIWSLGRYCECRVLATCSSWNISECHQVAADGENLSGTRISAASRWGFEKFSFLIYSPLRTESCLEKPAVESYSLILASAQLDHLSCLYGKLLSAWICLEAPSKLCVALSTVCFSCCYQIFPSLGWLPPYLRPVLILWVFLFVAAQFSLKLSAVKMISRFSLFSFCFLPTPIKPSLHYHSTMVC